MSKVFLFRFDAARLDVWWTCNLEFKVYLRSLNQRTPTLVGTATIGLKHVLMDGGFYKEVGEPLNDKRHGKAETRNGGNKDAEKSLKEGREKREERRRE